MRGIAKESFVFAAKLLRVLIAHFQGSLCCIKVPGQHQLLGTLKAQALLKLQGGSWLSLP